MPKKAADVKKDGPVDDVTVIVPDVMEADPAPAADGFAAPTVYADQANGGSGNLDVNDPDD